jgi:hypothetical protein
MYLWVRVGNDSYFKKIVMNNKGRLAFKDPCPYKDRKEIIENQLNAPVISYPSQK